MPSRLSVCLRLSVCASPHPHPRPRSHLHWAPTAGASIRFRHFFKHVFRGFFGLHRRDDDIPGVLFRRAQFAGVVVKS